MPSDYLTLNVIPCNWILKICLETFAERASPLRKLQLTTSDAML
jgi:hypothetical protein